MTPRKPKTSKGIEARWRPSLQAWTFRVRYTDAQTGVRRVEECDTLGDAEDFRAYLRLARRSGVLDDMNRGRLTVAEFVQTAWAPDAARRLANSTQAAYQSTYNTHLLPAIGHLELRQITPPIVEHLKANMVDAGAQAPTIRKALAVLQSIIAYAVSSGELQSNAVREVKKPKATRSTIITALSLQEIEALIAELRARASHDSQWMLAELIAYSGARPQDALALAYTRIGKQRLVYDHKNLDGQIVPGAKTGEDRARSVTMLDHLRRDLLHYRAAAKPNELGLVLVREDGKPWRRHDYKNWQRDEIVDLTDPCKPKVKRKAGLFAQAARAIGRPGITPYALRHSFASMRLAEQRLSLQEIAAEMGHSVEVLSTTYSHIISDYAGAGAIDPDEQIGALREGQTPPECPQLSADGA